MINFDNRLKKLKERRQGVKARAGLESYSYALDSADQHLRESYERINDSAAVKYVIGAMAAVDPASTQVSINEGNRVADTLISMLETGGIYATKELQGSVALDIHIEGHSDVDMLILKSDIWSVQLPKLDGTECYSPESRSMIELLNELRDTSEKKLKSRYYECTVDCTGAKSIALEGGSLQRKVDIVPSCWFNTHTYQRSLQKHDRAVKIYDKKNYQLLENKPFLHMHLIKNRDGYYNGNLRKIARLLKNIIADMPNAKKAMVKNLSSYDIASIAYNMGPELDNPTYMDLGLLEKTRAYLVTLESYFTRDSLIVPDRSRKVFDNDKKVEALEILTKEVSDLAYSVYKDLMPSGLYYDGSPLISKKVVLG